MILLRRITDPSALPSEPVITAVTLAELSVGPLEGMRRAGGLPAVAARPGLAQLGDHTWDVVVDTWCGAPKIAELSASMLTGRVERAGVRCTRESG